MNTKPLYLVIAAVLAVGAWLFRYEVVGVGSGEQHPIAYRLDRWTGRVMLAAPAGTVMLEPIPAPIPQKKKAEPNPFDQFDK